MNGTKCTKCGMLIFWLKGTGWVTASGAEVNCQRKENSVHEPVSEPAEPSAKFIHVHETLCAPDGTKYVEAFPCIAPSAKGGNYVVDVPDTGVISTDNRRNPERDGHISAPQPVAHSHAGSCQANGWVSIVQNGPLPESDVQVEWCDIKRTGFRCFGEYRGEGSMWNGQQFYKVSEFTHWRKAEPLPPAPTSVPQAEPPK